MKRCHVCGGIFVIQRGIGIANHVDEDDGIDHDLDEDHVPYSLDETPTLEPVYLERRALATVLAALRYYRARIGGEQDPHLVKEMYDLATDGGTVPALNADEIDGLRETMNRGMLGVPTSKKNGAGGAD